jgi:small GTP-binding protein
MQNRKIIITGNFGVGKTSLFSQFLYKKFSDKYLTTIGVKVDKKILEVEGENVNLMLWDIAGEVQQSKIPHSYFLGAHGIIYVFDLNRPQTWTNIESDLEYLKKLVSSNVAFRLVGNKKDLFTATELEEIKSKLPLLPDVFTSAKNGENVEELFKGLALEVL